MKIFRSKTDNVTKYVFSPREEVSYIDNRTGKDIICVPCQTSCSMGCTFCHLTYQKTPTKNIHSDRIAELVEEVYKRIERPKDTLLISYMGAGEPMNNAATVVGSMLKIKSAHPHVRFGVATSMPRSGGFYWFVAGVSSLRLPVKLHLSLHTTDPTSHAEMMPKAYAPNRAMQYLNHYKHTTGNPVEVHYSLIDGVNDTPEHLSGLSHLLKKYDTPIKFLKYNHNPRSPFKGSSKETINLFLQALADFGIVTEYYEPPGIDIGASCGQFMMGEE